MFRPMTASYNPARYFVHFAAVLSWRHRQGAIGQNDRLGPDTTGLGGPPSNTRALSHF
jgi:hypothetical protein